MTTLTHNHPPDSNRGVETHTTQQIDWLSMTFPIDTKDLFPDGLPTETQKADAYNAYDIGETYADGRQVFRHSTRTDMGIHVQMSGKCCARLQPKLAEIVSHAWRQGGKVTRIDLALNDICSKIHAEDATEFIRSGEQVCRAKEYPIRSDPHKGGYSQYAGKMSSEAHVVIYDKSAEQGEVGFHVRVEIRFKGKKADKAAHTYLQLKDCRAIIRGFLDFPTWKGWMEVFSEAPITIPSETHDSNRVRWLLTQVAASLAKQVIFEGENTDIMQRLHKAVQEEISDLRHKTE